MDYSYKDIEEYNPNKKCKIFMINTYDMITDMLSKKLLNAVVTELFIRGRKLSIFLVFITLSCFVVPKNIRLNSKNYFVMKIPNKREPTNCNESFIRYWLSRLMNMT